MNKIFTYIFSIVVFQLNAQSNNFSIAANDTALVNSIYYNPLEDAYSPVFFGVNSGADQYSLNHVANDYSWSSRLFALNYDELIFRNDTLPYFEGRYDYGSDFTHWFGADFSRNIGDSKLILNFNRNYTEDIYSNTEVERSNLVLGSKISFHKNYNLDFGYYRNNTVKSESGGVKNLEDYKTVDDLNIFTIDPLLSSAKNEVFNNGFILNQNFNLATVKDTVGKVLSKLSFNLNAKIEEQRLTFSMNESDIDSGYFQISYLDTIGTYDSIGFKRLIINPTLSWAIEDSSKSIGLGFRKENYDFDSLNRSQVELKASTLVGKNKFLIKSLYGLESLWANNYVFNAGFIRDSIGSSTLHLNLISSSITPEYNFHFYSGNHYRWKNQLNPVQTNSLRLGWFQKKYGFKLNGELSQIANYVYFDEHTSIQQDSDGVVIAKANFKHFYKYKMLEVTSSFNGQYSSSELIRIPNFYSRNTLSINGKARNVPLSLGAVYSYVAKYKGMQYDPAIRHFVLGNDNAGGFSIIDLFFVARVGTADLYVRYENLLFNSVDRNMFLGDNAPLAKPFLRFGLKWRLYN